MVTSDTATVSPTTPTIAPPTTTRSDHRSLTVVLLAALSMLPALATLWLIISLGRPQPYWDEWQWVSLLITQATTGIRFSDLIAQHNESRMLFPKVAVLAWTALLGHWDSRPGMFLSWALTLASSLLIRSLSVRTLSLSTRASWALLLPVNCVLFGWFQSETWTVGFQFVQVIPFTALLLALWIVTTNASIVTTVSLLAIIVFVTVYSFASGVLLWVVLFTALWAQRDRQLLDHKWLIALWWGLATVVIGFYFHGFTPTAGPENATQYALTHPRAVLAYCLVFLGSPLIRPAQPYSLLFPTILVAGGAIVLCYLAALAHTLWRWSDRPLRSAAAPWLALGGFVLLSAGLAAINRASMGVAQAATVRYATPAIYLPVALIYLMPLFWHRSFTGSHAPGQDARARPHPVVAAGLATALALLAILASLSNFDSASARVRNFSAASAALQFSASINADKILAEHMNNNLDELHRLSKQATELGILKPGVVRDSNVMPLALDPTDDLAATIDTLGLTATHAVASGNAVLLHRNRGADAIVVCGQRSLDDDPRVLAVFGELVVDPSSIGYAYLPSSWSRWNVRIRRQDIPSNITRLTFWAFDANVGSLYPLPRALDLPVSNPGN